MSWLDEHVRNFVIPGLRALVRAKGEDILATEIPPFKMDVRPAKGFRYDEAGMIAAALSSFGRSFTVAKNDAELDSAFSRHSKAQVSLEDLKKILKDCDPNIWSTSHGRYGLTVPEKHKWYDIIHTVVKNSWRSLRRAARGKAIILAGRDVWAWEIMARMDATPTVYDSRVSRLLLRDKVALDKVVHSWKVDFANSVVFDTGFAGSIHRGLCAAIGEKLGNIMLSTDLKENDPESGQERSCQIFPKHEGSRAKALTIEYFPKYFKTGTARDGVPMQYLAPLDEFIRAAAMTIWFWHYKSPRFIESPKRLAHLKKMQERQAEKAPLDAEKQESWGVYKSYKSLIHKKVQT